jgi:DNA polymerase family A/CHC2 zinc finger/Toprim domain
MPVLFRDAETRSTLDLKTCGAWRYAVDPTTEVLCVGYCVDDGAAQIWTPGQSIPNGFTTAARDPDWLIVAHNDQFETAIETRNLALHYGWPLIPIDRHRCTMAMAQANALPGSLEGAAAALGLPIGKDREGHRLMMQMAKPRKARKGENPEITYWHDGPDRRLRLQQYCQRDVELERLLYRRLPPLSDDEQALWTLDAAINRRGFRVDLELAESARSIVQAEQKAIDRELAELTDGKVTSVNQVAKLTALLQERGHKVTSLAKRSVSAVLAHDPSPEVRRLLELRQAGGLAAARKLDSLLAGVDADQRLRGTLKFHAASTGRWSGSRFQPQNLKRVENKDSLDAAIAAIRNGELEQLRALGSPLALVGDISRSLIVAAPGHTLIGADYSAIESRVLAWLAGETWKLNTYRKFDATGDAALEPYCVTASRILRRTVTPTDGEDRQTGKLCDLAFGYGGGLGAFKRIAPNAKFTDAEIEEFKTQWRSAHPMTRAFWKGLYGVLCRAVRTKEPMTFKNLHAEMRDGNLHLRLPSGRELVYPEARLEPDQYDVAIVYKNNAMGQWDDTRGWYGTFVENVVQAIARDALAEALPRLEAAGYPIVLHVHDEAIAEVPIGLGSADDFARIMSELPPWADGLPLVAKGWVSACYGAKETPAKPTESPTPPPSSPPKTNGAAVTLKPAVSAIAVTESDFAHVPLPALIGEPLIGGKILCPFHDDRRPSLHVYNDHFHCYTCGARGDHVDWLMMIENMTRDEALHMLANWDGATIKPRDADDDKRTLTSALQIWDAAQPITGTLAVRYLAEVRKIDVDALPTDDAALRFHPRCTFGSGTSAPCLLACYSDLATDEFAGVHRALLTDDVFNGAKVQRRMLGRWPSPRAIKLWPASDRLFLGEGLETVLAAATRLQYEDAPMRPAWAAGPGGMIGRIAPVPGVKELVLLVDHDANGMGAQYANTCRQLWRAAGRKVVRLQPEQVGQDFNDIVLEQHRAAP